MLLFMLLSLFPVTYNSTVVSSRIDLAQDILCPRINVFRTVKNKALHRTVNQAF